MDPGTRTHRDLPHRRNAAGSRVAGAPLPASRRELTLWEVGGGKAYAARQLERMKKGHRPASLSQKRPRFDVFFFLLHQEKDFFFFLTEQFVRGYIRTHRKQDVISFLPIFQGDRLHPRPHSVLHTVGSSSGFSYRKAARRDKERAATDPIYVFLAIATVIHLN